MPMHPIERRSLGFVSADQMREERMNGALAAITAVDWRKLRRVRCRVVMAALCRNWVRQASGNKREARAGQFGAAQNWTCAL
jgi:hypothetical protein